MEFYYADTSVSFPLVTDADVVQFVERVLPLLYQLSVLDPRVSDNFIHRV